MRPLPPTAFCALAMVAGLGLAACSGHGRSSQLPSSPNGTSAQQLPPGFSPSNGSVIAPPAVLDVTPLTKRLDPATMHKGALPAGQVKTLTQVIVNRALPTTVRPLLVDQLLLRPGEHLTFAAGDLGASPHDALVILQGPTNRYERLVQVTAGVAAGVVTLPAQLTPGVWVLATEDISGIHLPAAHQRPSGTVLLDLAVFTI